MNVRDNDRARVYDAEQLVRKAFDRADDTGVRTVEVLGSRITLPIERRFASVASVQTYVDQVRALNWVRTTWPRAQVPVLVRERAGDGAADYQPATATIAVPMRRGRWAAREFVILHELAHHLGDPVTTGPAHGPRFCDRYLELVDGCIGSEAAFLLRMAFSDCGVHLSVSNDKK